MSPLAFSVQAPQSDSYLLKNMVATGGIEPCTENRCRNRLAFSLSVRDTRIFSPVGHRFKLCLSISYQGAGCTNLQCITVQH